MTRYLLSTHTVGGERRELVTDGQMREIYRRLATVERDMNAGGAWVISARLHGPETATVVRVGEGDVLTTDGPFVESKEHLAGFYIIEADDLDAALSWAVRVSEAIDRPIEVRPLAAFADEPAGG